MKPVLYVIDDVLDAKEIKSTHGFFENLIGNNYAWIDKDEDVKFPLLKILSIVEGFFDLSTLQGCECWAHINTRTQMHIDIDDELWHRTGDIKYPICSIVYYPYIKNLQGGEFITKTFSVKPKQNRMIVFSPGISHGVEEFTGERTACAINPWSYKKQR